MRLYHVKFSKFPPFTRNYLQFAAQMRPRILGWVENSGEIQVFPTHHKSQSISTASENEIERADRQTRKLRGIPTQTRLSAQFRLFIQLTNIQKKKNFVANAIKAFQRSLQSEPQLWKTFSLAHFSLSFPSIAILERSRKMLHSKKFWEEKIINSRRRRHVDRDRGNINY